MSAAAAPVQVQASDRNVRKAVIGISYDEGKPQTYRGVRLTIYEADGSEMESRIIASGKDNVNVLKDYDAAIAICEQRRVEDILFSSSMDAYLNDLRKALGRA